MEHINSKLKPKKTGPFEVIETRSKLVYKLRLPKQWKIHPVFHATLLSQYNKTPEHGPNFTEPPPIIENEEERYEVKSIIAHKK